MGDVTRLYYTYDTPNSHEGNQPCLYFNLLSSEMEYCGSAASMLVEEIWQIAEGFVEVPANL